MINVEVILNLTVQIRWGDRLEGGYELDDGNGLLHASVDGVDFLIREQTPFDAKWWSHKYGHAALRYEIGISVSSGEIVWIFGPFPAGKYNDQRIYNLKMRQCLHENEKVLGDLGYGGPTIVNNGILNDADGSRAGRLRAYHENINGRMKHFNCLQHRWRHSVHKHHLCVFAVANLVQLWIRGSK